MSDPVTTIALATGGAFLSKFVGPAAESLGKAAWERAQQIGAKATVLLATVGREPQAVEAKVLIPMVQAAGLEENPALTEQWAALLANAADSAQRVAIPSFYTDILRQLTYQDTQILRVLYCRLGEVPRAGSLMLKQFSEPTGLSYDQILFSVDNLLRLRLLAAQPHAGPEMFRIHLTSPSTVISTPLGLGFMQAVTPPTL